VPFFIRTGKSLATTATQIVAKMRRPPAIFSNVQPPANYIRFQVSPDVRIAISALEKTQGGGWQGHPVELLSLTEKDGSEMLPYEELLEDAMSGNQRRFARQDYVEQSWRILDNVLSHESPVRVYEPGTWGPVEANSLTTGFEDWFNKS